METYIKDLITLPEQVNRITIALPLSRRFNQMEVRGSSG